MQNMEGPNNEETGRRQDLGKVSKQEGKEEVVSEIELRKKLQRKMMVEKWEDGKHRWTRGVDVEDASTTETLSCTIHR